MRAKNDGIAILVVGVGNGVNERELQGMASPPSALNIIRAASFNLLNHDLAKQLTIPVCNSECVRHCTFSLLHELSHLCYAKICVIYCTKCRHCKWNHIACSR